MLRRAGIIALSIFELVWLNVVIPGHTRGAVTMPCGCSTATSTASCPFCDPAAGNKPAGSHHSPTPGDREHCALCFFAAHLTIPPAVDLWAPRLLFLNYIKAAAAEHLIPRDALVPYDVRGPPLSA